MSAPPLSVNPLFAVPFISALLPSAQALNPALLALFGARATEAYRDGQLRPDPLCFRSREDLFDWPEPAAANLRGEVLGAVCQAVMAASTLTEAEFDGLAVQARARFVVVRPMARCRPRRCPSPAGVHSTAWRFPPPTRPGPTAQQCGCTRPGWRTCSWTRRTRSCAPHLRPATRSGIQFPARLPFFPPRSCMKSP